MKYIGIGIDAQAVFVAWNRMEAEYERYYAKRSSPYGTGFYDDSIPDCVPPLKEAIYGWRTSGENFIGFAEAEDGRWIIFADGARQGIPWHFLLEWSRDREASPVQFDAIFQGVDVVLYDTSAPHWKPWECLRDHADADLQGASGEEYERAHRLVKERREKEI